MFMDTHTYTYTHNITHDLVCNILPRPRRLLALFAWAWRCRGSPEFIGVLGVPC